MYNLLSTQTVHYKTMRIVTWNVNGLRSSMRKGFAESMEQLDADVETTWIEANEIAEVPALIAELEKDLA